MSVVQEYLQDMIKDVPTAKLEPDGTVTVEMMSEHRVPFITEWMTASQVARVLGLGRQHVNKLFNRGVFKTVAAIGERPTYVVRASEVEEMFKLRAQNVQTARAARLPSSP